MESNQIEVAIGKYLNVADTFAARGGMDQASALYEQVLQTMPMDLKIRRKLIVLLREHDQVEQALEHQLALADAYYELADCQGNAYAREGHRGRVLYLYPYDNGSPFRYVAKDAVEADTAYLSKFNSGGFSCVNEDSITSLIPLGINDLEVTGVADKGIWGVSEYAKPLVLQRP